MSFLIGTLRAMTLEMRSNDLTYRIMTITSRQQLLAAQGGELRNNYSEEYKARLQRRLQTDINDEDYEEIVIDDASFNLDYENQLEGITSQERLLDSERGMLETQLHAVTQEMEANEKLIDSDIKSSFGTLGGNR